MNLLARVFRSTWHKSTNTRRTPLRRRAQLNLEGLEGRLVPTGPPMPEFVVPLTQPADSSHFHSISAALGIFANSLPAGTVVIITIEPGAVPDQGVVQLTQGSVVIQGDPNVPAAILPGEQLQVTGSNYTLTNLNLSSLTLGSAPGDTATSRNLVSKCLITSLVENGIRSTFTLNTINGVATFNGVQNAGGHPEQANDDRITNNIFASSSNLESLSVLDCDGTLISQNRFFYSGSNSAIVLLDCGEAGAYFCTIANNIITSTRNAVGIVVLESLDNEAAVYVDNNAISTNTTIGLVLSGKIGSSKYFDVSVQGNDFRNNNLGVDIRISGDESGAHVDLGGGPAGGDLAPSLGGNDFRGFTKLGSFSEGAAIFLVGPSNSKVVSATGNMFSPGVSPPFVIDDGVEGSLTGSGQINAVPSLDNAHAYVQGLYNNLLGRTGNAAELNLWVNVLNTQGQAAVVNGILRSPESLGRIVDSLYIRFLGRQSDPGGHADWVNALQHGTTLEQVEQGFLTSPEYINHIDTDFVQSLYINLLGRTGDTAGLAAWNNSIQTLGLGGIANGFLTSSEFRADNIRADFSSFLNRAPSPTEVSNFVNTPTDLLSIEGELLNTQECFNNI